MFSALKTQHEFRAIQKQREHERLVSNLLRLKRKRKKNPGLWPGMTGERKAETVVQVGNIYYSKEWSS
jgi:hypothetical protein